jgi:hypothetical protein
MSGNAPPFRPRLRHAKHVQGRARSLTVGRIAINVNGPPREAAYSFTVRSGSCRTISPGSWPGVFRPIRALLALLPTLRARARAGRVVPREQGLRLCAGTAVKR